MNALKTLGVLAFLVAAFFTCRLYANAEPQIHCPDHTSVAIGESCPMPLYRAAPTETIDQPDLNGVICGQLALGGTSDGIADQVHEGDRRISRAQAGQQVRDAITECG
jgi:hypothetical protein